MKYSKSILEEFNDPLNGSLIMTGKLYRDKYSSEMSEAAFSQTVSRLYRSGEIDRIAKGVYCKSRVTRFGKVLPSDLEIIDLFTKNNTGLLVGYGLYNLLGVTTQISKCQTVYSSLADEQVKRIGNVRILRYDLEYSTNIKSLIQLMELLHHYRDIQDINVSAMLRCTAKLLIEYSDSAFETVQKTIGYPKWTIAFLRDILNYNNIPNHLNAHLSALSDYCYPRMEELYEAARVQN